MSNVVLPSLQQIEHAAQRIAPHVIETPLQPCHGSHVVSATSGIDLSVKLELFQHTGSFKPRGAINTVLQLDEDQRRQGITAFSAGNHAIATAYAANACGVSAKVVMPETANPYRVKRSKEYGAEVLFAASIAEVLDVVKQLQTEEQRTLVHPFEGEATTIGTATVGLEICRADKALDAIVVPVGGGGLISGIALGASHLSPGCRVYGVEPTGASGMSDSLAVGEPMPKVNVNTIADSLGAPLHLPYSFSVVQQCVAGMVQVSDAELKSMMRMVFEDLKLAVEPAGAAALAAIVGPLKEELQGKRVCAVVCGSNIDVGTWERLVAL